MKYYKVITNVNNMLYSANYGNMVMDNLLEYLPVYELNEWTKPKVKHTKLFVFDSYDAARASLGSFYPSRDYGTLEIYECDIVGKYKPDKYLFYIHHINRWFKKLKGEMSNMCEVQSGAVACNRIKLIQKVY